MWLIRSIHFFGLKGVQWACRRLGDYPSIRIEIDLPPNDRTMYSQEVISYGANFVKENGIEWITPSRHRWLIDLEKMKQFVPDLSHEEWINGKVRLEPNIFAYAKDDLNHLISNDATGHLRNGVMLTFYIHEESEGVGMSSATPPIEIQESLERFWSDHGEENKLAFIMMKFGATTGHAKIVEGIGKTLTPYDITALRADDKQYHDDLYWNILTYIFGCRFGIAVFERIASDEFNPNVSLELGYMMALKKEVCMLKDQTLPSLHSDLVGKLYKPFDTQNPGKTIPPVLSQWLRDKGLVSEKNKAE